MEVYGETALKSIYIITTQGPDIKSASRAKLALLKSLVETGEGRTPRPEEAAQNILQA